MEIREGLQRVGRAARQVAKSFDTRVEIIPLDAINDKSVAKTILQHIGNPALERMGRDRYTNPFSIVNVLANMGYVAKWNDEDYMGRFPEEYRAVRQSLHKLSGFGAIELVPLEENDRQKESIYYKVVDKVRLKDISKGRQIPQAKSA